MADQCKHCSLRGDLNACLATDCSKHEDWYAVEQQKRIDKLESKIAAHNEECIRVCELTRNGSHMGCDPRYGPDKRRTCPECPRDWMIEE